MGIKRHKQKAVLINAVHDLICNECSFALELREKALNVFGKAKGSARDAFQGLVLLIIPFAEIMLFGIAEKFLF